MANEVKNTGRSYTDVIDGARLRADLTAMAQDKTLDDTAQRRAALDCLRTAHRRARGLVRDGLESGLPGRQVAQLLCHIQDVIIQALYDFTTIHVYRSRNPTVAERLSIVAVGGYGRGDLAPYSDIDLLFVLPYKQTPWGESVIEYMLYMLWDLGLKVGHATRSIKQCVQFCRRDMTIRTSVLEMRYLWGDEGLFQELKTAFWQEVVPGTDKEFIEAKLSERNRRHERAGGSRYLVEPNIKEGKGGLRDLNTLFWIGKYIYRVEQGIELVDAGLFTKSEFQKILAAYSFLWSVRCHLHFYTGRAEERLSFDVQPELAQRMAYRNSSGQSAVERFMKHYFLIAKDVGDLTRIFCAALESSHAMRWPRLGRLLRFRPQRRALPDGFFVEGRRLNVTGKQVFFDDPTNLIRLFHVADEKSCDIHPTALRLVKRSLKLVDGDLRNDPEANRLFLNILTSKHDPERALRRMSEAGVLGKFVLAFGRIEAMMQFNMYHHYTVDEHTIRAIGILSRIEHGELAEEHPLSNDIVHKVLSREVLYMALFLHDIAKGQPQDHSMIGAQIGRSLCPRLGMSKAETETVAWLVENHLVMSEFALSRDTTDPRTIEDFVKIVQSPERLRLLLVLTVADIRAVGPGVWNGWKGQLLRDFYYEAETVLQGGAAPGSATHRDQRIAAAKQALAVKIADWSEAEREQQINCHGDIYWLSFDQSKHLRYANMMRAADLSKDGVTVRYTIDSFKSITEIAIYTKDEPGLFAQLAGAIAISGASIQDAKIFTTTDGKALDIFQVQDTAGRPFGDTSRLRRLTKTVNQTISGEIIPGERLSGAKIQTRVKAFTVEPQVLIDNRASVFHTIIEVNGRDRPGLLYELARAITEQRLTIASAHISTYGARAVDVFYVKNRAGLKITNQAAIAAIRGALVEALSPEAGITSVKAAE